MRRILAFVLGMAAALAPLSAAASLVRETVDYEQAGRPFKSYLVYHDRMEGKRPGVLVFPEWWGLNSYAKMRADQLADMGYAAMAVDIYGEGRNTQDAAEAGQWSQAARDSGAMLANARAAYEAFSRHARVDPNQMAAIGFCFGGATALKLALTGANLRSLVVFHGTLFLPTAEEARQLNPPLLLLHGGRDPLTPLETLRGLLSRLDQANKDWQLVVYSQAVHAFTNPNAGSDPQSGSAYDARAAGRAWTQMKVFFDDTFAPDQGSAAALDPGAGPGLAGE